jgi:hypothetical protein
MEYLSLPDAVTSLRKKPEAVDLGRALCNLLHSNDLAAEVVYCYRRDGTFVDEAEQPRWPADGELARTLTGAVRPLSLLDIPDEGLDSEETRFLSEVHPDLILPVTWNEQLQAVAFLQHGHGDHEYGVSENFALELLMRLLTELGDRASSPETDSGATEESKSQVEQDEGDPQLSRMRSLLKAAESLEDARDEGVFWEKFWNVLVMQVSASALVVLENRKGKFVARVCLGLPTETLAKLPLDGATERKYLHGFELPVAVADFPAALANLKTALEACGFTWLVPLREGAQRFGVGLVASPSTPAGESTQADLLGELFQIAARLVRRLRERLQAEARNLGIVEALVAETEKRYYGTSEISRNLVDLVRKLAREVGFPSEQERDLVYGALLRDIGMIATGDPLVDTDQKMTEEQSEQLRSHPTEGIRLMESLPVSQTVKDVILGHHERFNGEGYPGGLRGRNIPLAARIVSVVENFVAMLTPMPNRPALSRAQAMEILRENFGQRYDPDIVEVFLQMFQGEASTPESQTPAAPN